MVISGLNRMKMTVPEKWQLQNISNNGSCFKVPIQIVNAQNVYLIYLRTRQYITFFHKGGGEGGGVSDFNEGINT